MQLKLSRIRHWIFDLDNTLYASEHRLFEQVSSRITLFIEARLKLDSVAARQMQKQLFQRYGTTLAGLMQEHRLDPHDFLSFVHAIDYSVLPANPALRNLLTRLPGRKYIHTNATISHSEKALARLGLDGIFAREDIFDIQKSEWTPKPGEENYDRMLTSLPTIDPAEAVFFDDMACNLMPAKKRGLVTVFIQNGERSIPEARPDKENPPDFIINRVEDFLESFLAGKRP